MHWPLQPLVPLQFPFTLHSPSAALSLSLSLSLVLSTSFTLFSQTLNQLKPLCRALLPLSPELSITSCHWPLALEDRWAKQKHMKITCNHLVQVKLSYLGRITWKSALLTLLVFLFFPSPFTQNAADPAASGQMLTSSSCSGVDEWAFDSSTALYSLLRYVHTWVNLMCQWICSQ